VGWWRRSCSRGTGAAAVCGRGELLAALLDIQKVPAIHCITPNIKCKRKKLAIVSVWNPASEQLLPAQMDINALYMDHCELATSEELEKWNFDERGARIPTFPNTWDRDLFLMVPDAMGRSEWEQRSPALSLNEKNIQALQQHAASPKLLDVQRRIMFDVLREKMLVQLISCSGADSVEALCDILRAELKCGVPAPAPTWYVFSTVTMGPRKLGYSACSRRGCLITESVTSAAFKKCGKCRFACYCSEQCQASDWATRHKAICSEAAENRKQMEIVGEMLQKFVTKTQRRSDPKKEKLGDRSAASSASAPTPNSRCIPNAPESPRQLPVTAPSRAHKQILPSDRKFKRELAQPVLRASRCDLVIAVFRCFLKCALLAILLVLVIEWVY
jgi:hypothetical protein